MTGSEYNENESLVHKTWIRAFNNMAEEEKNPYYRDICLFTAEVLESCGLTPALKKFLDDRALEAFNNER